jgi:hypothetical protein
LFQATTDEGLAAATEDQLAPRRLLRTAAIPMNTGYRRPDVGLGMSELLA